MIHMLELIQQLQEAIESHHESDPQDSLASHLSRDTQQENAGIDEFVCPVCDSVFGEHLDTCQQSPLNQPPLL